MNRLVSWGWGLVVVMSTLLLCGPALSCDKNRAAALYDEGEQSLAGGATKLAEAKFQESYHACAHYRVLLKIAQVRAALGRRVEAAEALERFLRDGGDAVTSCETLDVRTDIATLRGRVATLSLSSSPESAKLSVDGCELSEERREGSLSVAPGSHRIDASAEGYEPLVLTTTAVAGVATPVPAILRRSSALVSAAAAPVSLASAVTAPASPTATNPRSRPALPPAPKEPAARWYEPIDRKGGWALMGLSGALLLTAAVTGIMAKDLEGELDDRCQGSACERGDWDDVDRHNTLAQACTVSLVLAGLAGAGGGALFYVDWRHSQREAAALTDLQGFAMGLQGWY